MGEREIGEGGEEAGSVWWGVLVAGMSLHAAQGQLLCTSSLLPRNEGPDSVLGAAVQVEVGCSVQISTLRISDAANAQVVQGTRTWSADGLASDSICQTEALVSIQAREG